MDCRDYIELFLAPHADRELSGEGLCDAEDHVRNCPRCHGRLAAEQRLKHLIQASAPLRRVPADLRFRLRAALGADGGASIAERQGRGLRARRTARAVRWIEARPVRVALPFAAFAGLLLLAAFSITGWGSRTVVAHIPATPVFDLATASFDGLARGFTPNVATESAKGDGAYYAWVVDRDTADGSNDDSADLVRAYHNAGVPEEIYDFAPAGYGLYGGRIDQSVDGRPMAYTLYSGAKGQILSICMHAAGFSAPVGASYWAGTHTFFRYHDHSLCLTFSPSGHFISILVAAEPVTDLLRDVTIADAAASAS